MARWFASEAPTWSLRSVSRSEYALPAILDRQNDVVLLDIHLGSGPTGIDICTQVRSAGSRVSIIMLTGTAGVAERVQALDAGADEYLCKGETSPRELIRRIQVMYLRRKKASVATLVSVVTAGPVTVNLDNHGVLVHDQPVELSKQQRRLLLGLAGAQGQTVSQAELCRMAGIKPGARYKNLHNEVLRLRRLLGPEAAQRIQVLRGLGYRLG